MQNDDGKGLDPNDSKENTMNLGGKRNRKETANEKKERKRAVKEARKTKREQKSMLKDAFSHEEQRQAKLHTQQQHEPAMKVL